MGQVTINFDNIPEALYQVNKILYAVANTSDWKEVVNQDDRLDPSLKQAIHYVEE